MKQMLQARDWLRDADTVDGYDGAWCNRALFILKVTVAGLKSGTPRPVEIKLHQASRVLEIHFDDGKSYRLPCEYLRVYSPSAEVRGHGPGQEVLQEGKKEVGISAIEPVGHYAVKLVFTDGHDTGLYSWDYLYSLGEDQPRLWQQYLEKLALAGVHREPAGNAPPAPSTKPAWKKI
jgi:DUF971 family protein